MVDREGERRKDSNHLTMPERPGEQDQVGYREIGSEFASEATTRISDWL